MAHEARVRAHLSGWSTALTTYPDEYDNEQTMGRVIRLRKSHGEASSSLGRPEPATTHPEEGEAPQSEGMPPTTHTGDTPAMFPRLRPDSIFTDTLSSAEGGSQEARPPTDQGEEGPADDGDGETTALMQRTKKRKRGSPEPAKTSWVHGVLFLADTAASEVYTTG